MQPSITLPRNDPQAQRLLAMNRRQRKAWAAQQRQGDKLVRPLCAARDFIRRQNPELRADEVNRLARRLLPKMTAAIGEARAEVLHEVYGKPVREAEEQP